jgi:hypothetical protein
MNGAVAVLPGAGVSAVPPQPMSARDPGGDGGLAIARRPTDPKYVPEHLHPTSMTTMV